MKDLWHGLIGLPIEAGATDSKSAARLKVPEKFPRVFEVYKREYLPEIDKAWRLTEAILARLSRSVRDSGSQLFVFHAPARFSVNSVDWEQLSRNYGFSREESSSERVSDELEALLGRLQIASADPLDDLRERARELQ